MKAVAAAASPVIVVVDDLTFHKQYRYTIYTQLQKKQKGLLNYGLDVSNNL